MHPSRIPAVALALVLLASCNPDIGRPRASPSDDSLPGDVSVTLDPPAPLGAAPRVFRATVSIPRAAELDPARFVLIRGKVGDAHVRQLENEEVSHALEERMVPVLTWALDPSAIDSGPAVVVAPLVPLEPGETYAIASGEPPFAIPLVIAEDDVAPLLERIWPPVGGAAQVGLGVYCGADELPPFEATTVLDPGAHAATSRRGADGDTGRACLRIEVDDAGHLDDAAPLLGPPAAFADGRAWLLDPRPWSIEAEAPPVTPLACDEGEIPFGPGCARVLDDRILGRSPEAPLLWIVSGGGLDVVLPTAPGDPFVLAPVEPGAALSLRVATLDVAGNRARFELDVTTKAPMPHVVLSEVLANPLGPEPDQEWVELANDGFAPADLTGYVLHDIGGETPLPPAVLAPGAYALVVNEGFVEDDELDAIPPEGTLLLRVPRLGKGGLSNEGEPLKLADASGLVVSRFPAAPKPKAGLSVSRVSPGAPDGVAASFAIPGSGPTPGAANGE